MKADDMILLVIAMFLIQMCAMPTPQVERADDPRKPSVRLVKFRGDDAVWTCEPVTPTEAR